MFSPPWLQPPTHHDERSHSIETAADKKEPWAGWDDLSKLQVGAQGEEMPEYEVSLREYDGALAHHAEAAPHHREARKTVWTPAKLKRKIKMLESKLKKERAIQQEVENLKKVAQDLEEELARLVKQRTTISI